MNPAECKHTWGQWHEEASGRFRKCGWCGFVAVDNLTDAADAEADTLRAQLRIATDALMVLIVDANRLLDVYPRDYRGTYCEDLRRSVMQAKAALEQLSKS